MPQNAVVQLRRDTAANWTSVDPILEEGELGLELDTRRLKMGDGLTAWTSLEYIYIGFQPFGFSFGPKTPVASKNLTVFDSPIAWELPISLTNSQGTIVDSDTATAAAPSTQTDFDIQSPSGVSIATMRFAASSLTATFINASEDPIPIGQPVYIVCPANLNGIMGAIVGSLLGSRE